MILALASKSPARSATLRAAGITPSVFPSDVDEDAVLAAFIDRARARGEAAGAAEQVQVLARAKLEETLTHLVEVEHAHVPHDSTMFVVACDSMLDTDGQVVGKPGSPEEARRRILAMSGSTATLWTGHAVALLSAATAPGARREVLARAGAAASTVVHFADMDQDEVDAYVATGEPLHVAGSFTIDGLGGAFVRGVEGDPHNVVGISLPLLRTLAREVGVTWHELWDAHQF
ncbi:septum formation inhibitor Maf [Schaalia sp. 19OD2882]|uniref:Maf family protein n=1 Tax=Schaalia sp. 19OD2882 TaxID=2794089 RepID=UPI001C1EFC3B|nr:Maf family protein [Schaalia sp. 19OD2882]QWW20245.1 septum formation inhibitor Maf [Schaalia sp. 19OD2882]